MSSVAGEGLQDEKKGVTHVSEGQQHVQATGSRGVGMLGKGAMHACMMLGTLTSR